MIESLLLAVTRVSTLSGERLLTNATGFFFERDDKLFLMTSRHVVLDEASGHRLDHLAIELHIDAANVTATTQWLIPLYRDNRPVWREGIEGVELSMSPPWSSIVRLCRLLSYFGPSHPLIW